MKPINLAKRDLEHYAEALCQHLTARLRSGLVCGLISRLLETSRAENIDAMHMSDRLDKLLYSACRCDLQLYSSASYD